MEMKAHNEISFIMAEVGDAASQQDSLDLPLLESKPSEKDLAKLLEEKDALITNLLSEKTEQENTVLVE